MTVQLSSRVSAERGRRMGKGLNGRRSNHFPSAKRGSKIIEEKLVFAITLAWASGWYLLWLLRLASV
jgi:hypothetical protein